VFFAFSGGDAVVLKVPQHPTQTPKLNSRKRTQRTQREWDLKVSPAAIFVVFVFIIHLSCFAFFVFSRGNFGIRV
jgi:hypothetical protein